MKIWVSKSAIPISMARPLLAGWNKNRYRATFNKFSPDGKADKYRIYIPINADAKKDSESKTALKISAYLKTLGYFIADYSAGLASEINGKRTVRIGKLLHADAALLKEFTNDPARAASKKAHLLVVISRHPYDILGASFDRGWTSCMNLKDGVNAHLIKQLAQRGGIVAYVVENNDKNINRPIARLIISPYYNEDFSKSVLAISSKVYGAAAPGFVQTVQAFLKSVNAGKPEGTYTSPQGIYCETSNTVTVGKKPRHSLSDITDPGAIAEAVKAVTRETAPILIENPNLTSEQVLFLVEGRYFEYVINRAVEKVVHDDQFWTRVARACVHHYNDAPMSEYVDPLFSNQSFPDAGRQYLLKYCPDIVLRTIKYAGNYIPDAATARKLLKDFVVSTVCTGTAMYRFFNLVEAAFVDNKNTGSPDGTKEDYITFANMALTKGLFDWRYYSGAFDYLDTDKRKRIVRLCIEQKGELNEECYSAEFEQLLIDLDYVAPEGSQIVAADVPRYSNMLVEKHVDEIGFYAARRIMLREVLTGANADKVLKKWPLLAYAVNSNLANRIINKKITDVEKAVYCIQEAPLPVSVVNKVLLEKAVGFILSASDKPVQDERILMREISVNPNLSVDQLKAIVPKMLPHVEISFRYLDYALDADEDQDFCYQSWTTTNSRERYTDTLTTRCVDYLIKNNQCPDGAIKSISSADALRLLAAFKIRTPVALWPQVVAHTNGAKKNSNAEYMLKNLLNLSAKGKFEHATLAIQQVIFSELRYVDLEKLHPTCMSILEEFVKRAPGSMVLKTLESNGIDRIPKDLVVLLFNRFKSKAGPSIEIRKKLCVTPYWFDLVGGEKEGY